MMPEDKMPNSEAEQTPAESGEHTRTEHAEPLAHTHAAHAETTEHAHTEQAEHGAHTHAEHTPHPHATHAESLAHTHATHAETTEHAHAEHTPHPHAEHVRNAESAEQATSAESATDAAYQGQAERPAPAETATQKKLKRNIGGKLRKAFPRKLFLFGLAALAAGVLIFVIAPGNEPLTLQGFVLVLGGLLVPSIVLARRLLRKIFLWIPAALLLFVIIFPLTLAAYITFFFPNEIVRQILQAEISKALVRPVSIGYLKISIFTGIRLSNLVVSDRDGSAPFVSAGLTLSYQLLPILIGQLRVHSVILEEPTIHIRRDLVDGRAVMNIDDLLAGSGEEAEEPPAEDGGIPALPFSISVGEIGLRNGSVSFTDRGTPGFANEYLLDSLDCSVTDITWPIVEPLAVLFNFHIAMRQLDVEDGKTFTLVPGLTGKVLLRYVDESFVPEGRVDFYARDGEFYGQEFLTEGQNFLEGLKLSFFEGITSASVGNLDAFENELLSKTTAISSGVSGKLDEIVGNANKEFNSLIESLTKNKLLASDEFDTNAKKENDDIIAEANKLTQDTRTVYSRLMKTHPAAANKLNIDTYLNQVQAKVEGVQNEYTAYIQAQTESLTSEIDGIIASEQKRYTDYIGGLQGNFNAAVERYAGAIRDQFTRQINRAEDFINSYDLDIPFLRKRMRFDRVGTLLTITNGLMHLQDLVIHGEDFSVEASGSYNMINDDIDVRAKIVLAAHYASNTILGLFKNSEGAPELEFEVSVLNGRIHFALLGEPIPKRMGAIAADKAKEYMHSFIAKNVTTESLLASLRMGDSHENSGKNAILNAKTSRLSSLAAEKLLKKQALTEEGKSIARKIEEDALKAIAGSIPIKIPF